MLLTFSVYFSPSQLLPCLQHVCLCFVWLSRLANSSYLSLSLFVYVFISVSLGRLAMQQVLDNVGDPPTSTSTSTGAKDIDLLFLRGIMESPIVRSQAKVAHTHSLGWEAAVRSLANQLWAVSPLSLSAVLCLLWLRCRRTVRLRLTGLCLSAQRAVLQMLTHWPSDAVLLTVHALQLHFFTAPFKCAVSLETALQQHCYSTIQLLQAETCRDDNYLNINKYSFDSFNIVTWAWQLAYTAKKKSLRRSTLTKNCTWNPT